MERFNYNKHILSREGGGERRSRSSTVDRHWDSESSVKVKLVHGGGMRKLAWHFCMGWDSLLQGGIQS